jgi:hypothetical protein
MKQLKLTTNTTVKTKKSTPSTTKKSTTSRASTTSRPSTTSRASTTSTTAKTNTEKTNSSLEDADDLINYKLGDLKEMCRGMKLKMTGKKEDLILRIKKHFFFSRHKITDKNCVFSKGAEKYLMKDSEKFILRENNLYQSLTSFDKHYFLYDCIKKVIVKKVNSRRDDIILDLTRDDIQFLKSINLDYEVPVVLSGEPTRFRDVSQLEEEDLFEECNEEDFE